MPKIKSVKSLGQLPTRDLEVEHSDHQFYLANGVLTSNSHAVAYSIDSYQCAWLLTYYEPEWLAAYAETMIGDPDNRETMMSEVKSIGYSIGTIDINRSGMWWEIDDVNKQLMPSFRTAKGIGVAAIEEILAQRPYRDLQDMLWKPDGGWRHSKFNKRVLETLIKVSALQSLDAVGPGKLFSNYRHMHDTLIEWYDDIKRKNGLDTLVELIVTQPVPPDWDEEEKLRMQRELIGNINVDELVPAQLRERLTDRGVGSIDDIEVGTTAVAWCLVTDSVIKTSKNGKKYLQMTAMGPTGIGRRLMCWGYKGDTPIRAGKAYLAEIKRDDMGFSTTAWRVRPISWSKEAV